MGIKLENYINKYLPHKISDHFRTLDGKDVAEWLKKEGYEIKEYKDKKRNGVAITKTGINVSTNGYVFKQVISHKKNQRKGTQVQLSLFK